MRTMQVAQICKHVLRRCTKQPISHHHHRKINARNERSLTQCAYLLEHLTQLKESAMTLSSPVLNSSFAHNSKLFYCSKLCSKQALVRTLHAAKSSIHTFVWRAPKEMWERNKIHANTTPTRQRTYNPIHNTLNKTKRSAVTVEMETFKSVHEISAPISVVIRPLFRNKQTQKIVVPWFVFLIVWNKFLHFLKSNWNIWKKIKNIFSVSGFRYINKNCCARWKCNLTGALTIGHARRQ